MGELNVRRWTGAFGIASGVLILVGLAVEVPILPLPRPEDAAHFSQFVTKNNGLILTITFIYTVSAACFVIFLAGLRQLIRRAKRITSGLRRWCSAPDCSTPLLLLVG